MRWYKREPRALLDRTIGLDPFVRGQYALLLDVMHLHEGGAPDDDRYLAGQLGLTVRQWRRVREVLLAPGPDGRPPLVLLVDGRLTDEDVITEQKFRADLSVTRASAGREGGLRSRKRGAEGSGNKGLGEANAGGLPQQTPSKPLARRLDREKEPPLPPSRRGAGRPPPVQASADEQEAQLLRWRRTRGHLHPGSELWHRAIALGVIAPPPGYEGRAPPEPVRREEVRLEAGVGDRAVQGADTGVVTDRRAMVGEGG